MCAATRLGPNLVEFAANFVDRPPPQPKRDDGDGEGRRDGAARLQGLPEARQNGRKKKK